MKLSDIKEGDTIVVDGGFTCMKAGEKLVKGSKTGLYVDCNDESGRHYLDGQEDEKGELIGIHVSLDEYTDYLKKIGVQVPALAPEGKVK